MKIRFFGQRNNLGVGTHFSNLIDVAKKTYYLNSKIEEIDATNTHQAQQAINSASSTDINIWFFNNPYIQFVKGTNILWTIFESDKLSQDSLNSFRQSQVIWVPSKWGRDVLIQNGINQEMIDVVPEGVDANLYHPFLRSSIKKENQPFRFLMVGKFEKRKAYEELLQGFQESFGNSDEVELVIKGDHFINYEAKKMALTDLVSSFELKNVKLCWGNWQKENLVALYNSCDVFVFPSRAEGWGLPLLEAAATGMPLISTYYSGHTEFLEVLQSSLLRIDFTMQPINDPEFKFYWPSQDGNYGRWAQPNVDSISANLKAVKENYSYYYAEARKNSLTVREKFSWENSWSQALSVLDHRNLIRSGYSVQG